MIAVEWFVSVLKLVVYVQNYYSLLLLREIHSQVCSRVSSMVKESFICNHFLPFQGVPTYFSIHEGTVTIHRYFMWSSNLQVYGIQGGALITSVGHTEVPPYDIIIIIYLVEESLFLFSLYSSHHPRNIIIIIIVAAAAEKHQGEEGR